MAKKDFGRFRARGVPNPAMFITTATPVNPIRKDLHVYPGAGGKFYIKKTSDEGVASSTTMQNDDDFYIYFAYPGTYEINANILANGDTSGDIKIDWVEGGGINLIVGRRCVGPAASSTSNSDTTVRRSSHSLATDVTYGLNASYSVIDEKFIVSTASTGTLQMRWAQNASSGTRTTVSSHSYVTVEKLKTDHIPAVSTYDGSAWDILVY